ncbi:MAG: BON domain-containing protein [Chloroflexota bacterium]|nr:BON domain-containing protein [Chloroflexota bacterium]
MAQSDVRPDSELLDDFGQLIIDYPPLRQDRRRINVTANQGVISVTGHVRTPITMRYLLDRLAQIEGVRGVTAAALYDDESLQRAAGRVLGGVDGVVANVIYGIVILTGKLDDSEHVAELAAQIAQIPGVVEVAAKVG